MEHRQVARCVVRDHLNIQRLDEMRASTVFDLLTRCDAFRRPERIAVIATACEADKRGRAGLADVDYPSGRLLRAVHAAALAVKARDLPGELQGEALGSALRRARIAAIAEVTGRRK